MVKCICAVDDYTKGNPHARILHLTLKKKWFDMILSGDKKEEYRLPKKYWETRLTDMTTPRDEPIMFKSFDFIEFKNGYSKNAPKIIVEFLGCKVRMATTLQHHKWGGELGCIYFTIKLGKVISSENVG